jgi:glycogen debranching enzyme
MSVRILEGYWITCMKYRQKKSGTSRGPGREWICANRRGGYALGAADLINRRKYHGLLVAFVEGAGRVHLVSTVEERIGIENEYAFLDAHSYHGLVYPDGHLHLISAALRPYPGFVYSFQILGREVRMGKEILMAENSNLTLVRYTNMGPAGLDFAFRYQLSMRDHHHVNSPGTFDALSVSFEVEDHGRFREGKVLRQGNGAEVFIYASAGELAREILVYRNIVYPVERMRGYDFQEDLVSPFIHRGTLGNGQSMITVFCDNERNDLRNLDPRILYDEIRSRYSGCTLPEEHPAHTSWEGPGHTGVGKKARAPTGMSIERYRCLLELMLDDFRTENDIIAGFPWFSPWGRDTMIALEAYMHQEGNTGYTFTVLRTYGERMISGIVPNVIGEAGRGGNYDTIDASLWFVLRAFELFGSLDPAGKEILLGFCEQAVLNYRYNCDLPFYFDPADSLLSIRESISSALTWMDAKISGVPVTPRCGKPVEINGLWYNALKAIKRMAGEMNREVISFGSYRMEMDELESCADMAGRMMKRFYHGGTWCDRIENGTPVCEIRPNFVIACSLPFDFTDPAGLSSAAATARTHLLTGCGLRSLSPEDVNYRGVYEGDQDARDRAYHQGTVWTWLLLPYAKLVRKTVDRKERLKIELEEIVCGIRERVIQGFFASIAEVWDGDAQDEPKGAPAQAWSVAALFCIEKMLESLEKENDDTARPARSSSG